MDIDLDLIERVNTNPLYQTIGIRLEAAAGGEARSTLDPRPDTCWPFESQPHGGMLFTLMDTTMAWAVQSNLQPDLSCTTIDLNIHFILPARGERFHCRAGTIHQTGRMSFVQGEISDTNQRILATGQAAFRIIKMSII